MREGLNQDEIQELQELLVKANIVQREYIRNKLEQELQKQKPYREAQARQN